MTYEEIQNLLKSNLKEKRYIHTLGVVETAIKLAKIYHCDIEQARLAALLHDCAKHMPEEERISYCESHNLNVTKAERENLSLLHAKCGSILANELYGVADKDIQHAIMVHTTGAPNMSLLDKIVFVSDYLEPNRTKAPHLEELRELVLTDLDLTVYRILDDTLRFLISRQKTLDPTTKETHAFYAR